jgi:cytochrome c-type biogenesis protein CcmH/NrfG
MTGRWVNGLVLAAAGVVWMASGTERERAVLSPVGEATNPSAVAGLEADVAASPDDDAKLRTLAQAYLDAHAPGLALAVMERAPDDVRVRSKVLHLYARALLEEGHAQDALAVERTVLRSCTRADGVCDAWLIASARRRADILEELVGLGVEDARAEPEASAVAYHNATREARLAVR